MRIFFDRSEKTEEIKILVSKFLASAEIGSIIFEDTVDGCNVIFADNDRFTIEDFRKVEGLEGLKDLDKTENLVIFSSVVDRQIVIDYANSELNKKAVEYGYYDISSACSYVTSGVEKFNLEGRSFAAWRDAMWVKCFQLIEDLEKGLEISLEEFSEHLPVFENFLESLREP